MVDYFVYDGNIGCFVFFCEVCGSKMYFFCVCVRLFDLLKYFDIQEWED